VLESWNVDADSVVFVDDSPIELAEVAAAHPRIECVQFPAQDPRGVYDLVVALRDRFGRAVVTDEDRVRLASLRNQAAAGDGPGDASDGYSEAVLEAAQPELTLEFQAGPADARALELINKTNQFNLNGRRFTEREWAEHLAAPGAFLLTATYKDRFGPLGKIAVLAGRLEGEVVHVDAWVMSCRAFARRIEHQCLKALFSTLHARTIAFAYEQTPRNGPLAQCLHDLLDSAPGDGPALTLERFEAACPSLPHHVTIRNERNDERYAGAPR
jgi:FkbH-like protein